MVDDNSWGPECPDKCVHREYLVQSLGASRIDMTKGKWELGMLALQSFI